MQKIKSSEAIIVLDDCEASAKGIQNLLLLKKAFPNYLVLQDIEGFSSIKFDKSSTLCLMVPQHIIKVTEQQMLPLTMY